MFDYSKLSNMVGSLSDSSMRYTLWISLVGSAGIQLGFHLLSSSKNWPFWAWSYFLQYQSCHFLFHDQSSCPF